MATPSGWNFKNMVLIGQFYLLVVDWLVNTHFCDGGHLLGKNDSDWLIETVCF